MSCAVLIGKSYQHYVQYLPPVWLHESTCICTGLSKRLRVAGEMGKESVDFLIFIFLILVKLSFVCSEKLGHYFIRIDSEICQLLAYFDIPVQYMG